MVDLSVSLIVSPSSAQPRVMQCPQNTLCPLTWSCVYIWPGVQRLPEELWSVLGEQWVWVLTNRPDQQASKCSPAAVPRLLWSKENVATISLPADLMEIHLVASLTLTWKRPR